MSEQYGEPWEAACPGRYFVRSARNFACICEIDEYERVLWHIDAQAAEIAELRAVLRELEWCCEVPDSDDCELECPSCVCSRAEGHAPDCRLAAALGGGE